jgi:hypothetical protein
MPVLAATGAAAFVVRVQREIQQHFADKGAFAPDGAIAYEAPDPMHRHQLAVLVRRGILRDTGDGRYWIDRAAIHREQQFQAVILKIVLAAVAIVVVVGAAAALLKRL